MYEPPLHLGPVEEQGAARERFDPDELAMVLSHYELDVITSIREFPLGSRRSPKLRIQTHSSEYLLKRRASGRDDPYRVAFAHELLLHLKSVGFPVPTLYGTRDTHNSLLQLDGRTYELFEFVHGSRPSADQRTAQISGRALGELHGAVAGFESGFDAPSGTYHDVDLSGPLAQLPDAVAKAGDDADPGQLRSMCDDLGQAHDHACERVNAAGFAQWPNVVVHGDWHPGNLLLRGGRLAAAVDFDSARLAPRMIDVANAALQFSMRTGEIDAPSEWPEGISHRRTRALLSGYATSAERPLTSDEMQSLPWLMIEALIVESVLPIAAVGRFAHLSGGAFLTMVHRKVCWLRPRAAKLIRYVAQHDQEADPSAWDAQT